MQLFPPSWLFYQYPPSTPNKPPPYPINCTRKSLLVSNKSNVEYKSTTNIKVLLVDNQSAVNNSKSQASHHNLRTQSWCIFKVAFSSLGQKLQHQSVGFVGTKMLLEDEIILWCVSINLYIGLLGKLRPPKCLIKMMLFTKKVHLNPRKTLSWDFDRVSLGVFFINLLIPFKEAQT